VYISYICSQCQSTVSLEFDATTLELACPHCQQQIAIGDDRISGKRIKQCLVCPSTDLYVRKDFPQRLGVMLVGIGIIGSSIAWYHMHIIATFAILFATALADVLLYFFVGDALMCYRCDALYRGAEEMDSHGSFNLETHEKYRQQAARMKTS